jgi:hypothetical protein
MVDPTPAPAPAPPSPSPAPVPAPVADAWLTGVSDEQKGYVQNKGWKAPGELLESYVNLEKLRGVPAERLLTLPGDDKPESWNPIYDKLGRPKDAKGYEIAVPEGGDPAFVDAASTWFHEQGLSKKQGAGLAAKWNEHVAAVTKQAEDARVAKNAGEYSALTAEWGAAFDQNVGAATNAARALGFDAPTVDALEKTLGFAGVMKMMHSLGTKLGEAKFVAGGGPGGNTFAGAQTPEAAKARITALRADTDFVKRLTMGDAAAKDEWERTHKFAYPE